MFYWLSRAGRFDNFSYFFFTVGIRAVAFGPDDQFLLEIFRSAGVLAGIN
jgi:hypothetical protein